EPEGDAGALDLDVTLAHRRQAERPVLPRVLVVADADAGLVQEADDRRYHPGLAERMAGDVAFDPPPDPRQRRGERQHSVVLGLVSQLPPARVVAVLLAPAGVAARGLEMPLRRRADPHVRPCRRDGERLDPRPLLGVGDRAPVGVEVLEPTATPAPADAGPVVARVAQAGLLRRLAGVLSRRRHVHGVPTGARSSFLARPAWPYARVDDRR